MKRVPLNDPPLPAEQASAGEAAAALATRMLAALGAHTDTAGRVDYRRLAASREFATAVEASRCLGGVRLATLTDRDARLAFWINVYNALVLHAIVALGVRRSVLRTWNFFGRARYRVDGLVFSVDDVEHGVLRGNRRRVVPPLRPFGRRDPRRAHALEPPDPRAHFAITCGARSCPPVSVYRAAVIDAQLELATKGFVNQEVALDRDRLVCSRLFKWYRHDFDAAGGLGAFLLRYLDDGPARRALASGATPRAVFRAYDWSLQHPALE
ncbi:MAG: DUF547 domain-containing protein [Candidatus Rokuibacteriota bacterium]